MEKIFQTYKTLSLENKVGRLFIPTILDSVKDGVKYNIGLKETKDKIVIVPFQLSSDLLNNCIEVDVKRVSNRRLTISTSIMGKINYTKKEDIILEVFDNGVMILSKIK